MNNWMLLDAALPPEVLLADKIRENLPLIVIALVAVVIAAVFLVRTIKKNTADTEDKSSAETSGEKKEGSDGEQ